MAILDDVRRDAIEKLQSSTEDSTLLIDATVNFVVMSGLTHCETLLALEKHMEANVSISSFAKWLVRLVVDGTSPDDLIELATTEYWMRASDGICAMVDYMYIRGMLYIQDGWHGIGLANCLQTLIPQNVSARHFCYNCLHIRNAKRSTEKNNRQCVSAFC